MKRYFLALTMAILGVVAQTQAKVNGGFVWTNEKGQFVLDGTPYYYVGANFWYGSMLASKGQGGDRKRLVRELDKLKSIGVENLRVLVGADGDNGVKSRVEPSLQTAPGVYNDSILDGLDFLLYELGKREMKAVLYLTNAWEWSGGYSVYQQWVGMGKSPIPAIDGWPAYMEYVKDFIPNAEAKRMMIDHVRFIVSRTNRYNKKKYSDDTAIFAWQICNEPRAFSDEAKPLFAEWIDSVAAAIKAIDGHHLVSTGSEGMWGCEQDYDLFRRIHSSENIDYLTIHIWPYNWQWVSKDRLNEEEKQAEAKTSDYIGRHMKIAEELGKPLVIEEFGYPRDGFSFSPGSPTIARNNYFSFVFSQVLHSKTTKGCLAGCNFWAWGGYGQPKHEYWQRWDDYTGDPAQEQQGLNSVFAADTTTVRLLKSYTEKLEQDK